MIKPLALALLATSWPPAALPPNRDLSALECPIAGNVESGIYHLAGSRYHRLMLAGGRDRPLQVACFHTEAEAVRAGYRRSLR